MTTMLEEEDDFDSTDGDAVLVLTHYDRRYAGVRALWLKVIIRAIYDWVTYKDSTKVEKKKFAESADIWLFQESLLFNSFENVCRQLDIDPVRIRAKVKTMTKEDVLKIEHLERDCEEEEVKNPTVRRTLGKWVTNLLTECGSKSSRRVSNEDF